MKNSRMKIMAVLFAVAVTLSGCGDALYEMTAEEQDLLVTYAAQTVAKFNTYQQDGEISVAQEVLDGEENMGPSGGVAQDGEEPADMSLDMDTEEPGDMSLGTDTEEPADMPDAAQPAQPDGGQSGSGDSVATMTEALDLGMVSADYVGKELTKSYMAEDYYAVDAEPGKQFLVVKYNLVNKANQALHIDILAMTPTFVAVVNGDQRIPAQTTILLNDLSTYQGDIEVGGTNETVLLFQIPEDVEDVSSIQLNVTMNGKQFAINL